MKNNCFSYVFLSKILCFFCCCCFDVRKTNNKLTDTKNTDEYQVDNQFSNGCFHVQIFILSNIFFSLSCRPKCYEKKTTNLLNLDLKNLVHRIPRSTICPIFLCVAGSCRWGSADVRVGCAPSGLTMNIFESCEFILDDKLAALLIAKESEINVFYYEQTYTINLLREMS